MRGPDPLRNTAPRADAGKNGRYTPLPPGLRPSVCNKLLPRPSRTVPVRNNPLRASTPGNHAV